MANTIYKITIDPVDECEYGTIENIRTNDPSKAISKIIELINNYQNSDLLFLVEIFNEETLECKHFYEEVL